MTKQIISGLNLNVISYENIKPGDLAVTANGIHIMAYLGNKTWIEADPYEHKVIIVKIPEYKNVWFNKKIIILRLVDLQD